jgi:general secretion pathway protein E/type IV pilus assembly protein PilB
MTDAPVESSRVFPVDDLLLREELTRLFPQYAEKIEGGARRKSLDAELCGHGILNETDLLKAYVAATQLVVVEEEEIRNPERFPGVSVDYLTAAAVVPFRWDDRTVHIAVADPYGLNEIDYFFRQFFGLAIEPYLARRSHIERVIQAVYLSESDPESDRIDLDLIGNPDSEEALLTLASEARIVRLVGEMFSRAVELDASDIHVEPDESKLAIRYRIDGRLQEIMSPPLSLFPAIASRIKLIGGLNIAERRLAQDGRTDLQIGKVQIDVRISCLPSMTGESIVLRILRKDAMDFDLTQIGMNDVMRVDFEKLVNLPHGMLLVVGPTGSGKSTTLYSVIRILNHVDQKIITIEDPVEYRTAGITQIQVDPKIGRTFANGLRSIVRQDPDIILVGEIRDKETAEIAIHAALTGHMVFSTLHTNDAPGAISRLLDMGVEGFLISSSLSGVLSQRLVRKICTVCKGTGQGEESGKKCRNCAGTGFRGRIGIFELMVINDEIRDCINQGKDSGEIAKVAVKYGMRPLIEDGMAKVRAGITTQEEVTGVAVNV